MTQLVCTSSYIHHTCAIISISYWITLLIRAAAERPRKVIRAPLLAFVLGAAMSAASAKFFGCWTILPTPLENSRVGFGLARIIAFWGAVCACWVCVCWAWLTWTFLATILDFGAWEQWPVISQFLQICCLLLSWCSQRCPWKCF